MALTTEQIEKVNQVLKNKLNVGADKLVPTADIVEDLGADSLDQVEIIMALEDELNIEIPDETAEKMKTVQSTYDVLSSLLS
jgi:acyl carrier protein